MRRLGITKCRRYTRVSGVSPDIDIVPFNHDIDTLERAVKERVFFVKNIPEKTGLISEFAPPPKPLPNAFGRLDETAGLLGRYLPSTARGRINNLLIPTVAVRR